MAGRDNDAGGGLVLGAVGRVPLLLRARPRFPGFEDCGSLEENIRNTHIKTTSRPSRRIQRDQPDPRYRWQLPDVSTFETLVRGISSR